MNRFLAAICVTGLTLNLSGCGSSADSLVKEQVAAFKDLADAAQAKDSGKVDAAIKRISDLNEQMKKLSVQEIQEAQKKYASELQAQIQRVVAADPFVMMKVGLSQVGQMGDAFKAMGGEMQVQMKQMMPNPLKMESKQPGQ